ncbi:hypothetical protein AX16_009031 [Volvariella volvacea WC 439]|nr:hypothetical protein AX16_009031 [Volvariella volvacea WC 439]
MKYTILTGGFTTFIGTLVFDSVHNTLSVTQKTTTNNNPSWIATHPENSRVLYAVNELSPIGNLQTFSVDDHGIPHLVDTISTLGNGPTYTEFLSTGEVSGMNFGSPNASFPPTFPNDPLRFQRDPQTNDLALNDVVSFPVGDGPSNPHQSLEYGGEVFVPDLGADKIWRLRRDDHGKFFIGGQIDIDPGAGPRHIAIYDNLLYTIHEKTSTLTVQAIPPGPNGTTLPLIANVSIIPPNQPAGAQFFAAEIVISPPNPPKFPNPLIYTSNRNIATEPQDKDPNGDAIAIFEFVKHSEETYFWDGLVNRDEARLAAALSPRRKKVYEAFLGRRLGLTHEQSIVTGGSLNLVKHVFTKTTNIRSFSIGRVEDGGDEFLIAAGVAEGGTVMFKRIHEGRDLMEVARNNELEAQSCFVFL